MVLSWFPKRIADVIAGVVEMVDTPDLGSGGEIRGGSSHFTRTIGLALERVS